MSGGYVMVELWPLPWTVTLFQAAMLYGAVALFLVAFALGGKLWYRDWQRARRRQVR